MRTKTSIFFLIFIFCVFSCLKSFSQDQEHATSKLNPTELCAHFYNKTHMFEKQIYEMCGQSCDALLKKNSTFDNLKSTIYFVGSLALLGIATGVAVSVYSCANGGYLKGPYVFLPWAMALAGFFGAKVINKPSPLCAFTCQEMRDYQQLFKNVFGETQNCANQEA